MNSSSHEPCTLFCLVALLLLVLFLPLVLYYCIAVILIRHHPKAWAWSAQCHYGTPYMFISLGHAKSMETIECLMRRVPSKYSYYWLLRTVTLCVYFSFLHPSLPSLHLSSDVRSTLYAIPLALNPLWTFAQPSRPFLAPL